MKYRMRNLLRGGSACVTFVASGNSQTLLPQPIAFSALLIPAPPQSSLSSFETTSEEDGYNDESTCRATRIFKTCLLSMSC